MDNKEVYDNPCLYFVEYEAMEAVKKTSNILYTKITDGKCWFYFVAVQKKVNL